MTGNRVGMKMLTDFFLCSIYPKESCVWHVWLRIAFWGLRIPKTALSIKLEVRGTLALFPGNIQMTIICRMHSHMHSQTMGCNTDEIVCMTSNSQWANCQFICPSLPKLPTKKTLNMTQYTAIMSFRSDVLSKV